MPNQVIGGLRWEQFWKERRNDETANIFAKKYKVSAQAVCKPLKSKHSKIDHFILSAVKASRMRIYRHNNVERSLLDWDLFDS
ncbi:MAG: hypothetical protein ACXACK_15660 [Candidatus Hodarchaeales archaeon]|jgi:hypothetical protein